MNKTSREFFGKAQGICLRPEEKGTLLREMRSFMEKHPVTSTSEQVLEKRSEFLVSFFKAFRVRLFPLVASFVLIFSIGTPMYAAENSLPGDILYAIKIGINEQLRSFLSFSPTSKALWEIRRAERRLEEASTLLEKGELSEEEGEEILKMLRANMDSVEKYIKTITSR